MQRGDCTHLPATHHFVQDSSAIQKALSFAEWQRVENGRNETVWNVEGRVSVIASAAQRVLRYEVVPGAANGASVIQGFGPCVAEQCRQIGSETLTQFRAQAIVVADAVILQMIEGEMAGASRLRRSLN